MDHAQLGVVEPGHHLVEEDQPGLAGQGAGQLEESPFVQIQVGHLVAMAVTETDHGQDLPANGQRFAFGTAAGIRAEDRPQGGVLEDAHARKDPGGLLDHGDAQPGGRCGGG